MLALARAGWVVNTTKVDGREILHGYTIDIDSANVQLKFRFKSVFKTIVCVDADD